MEKEYLVSYELTRYSFSIQRSPSTQARGRQHLSSGMSRARKWRRPDERAVLEDSPLTFRKVLHGEVERAKSQQQKAAIALQGMS